MNINILYSFLILLAIIVLIFLLCALIKKFSPFNKIDEEMHEYDILTPLKDKGKYMNPCPVGCIRGTCDKKKNKNNCKYDFQCQYCDDSKTQMFYVNFDEERHIVPLYQEEHKLSNNQTDDLNSTIKNNNEYIRKLNISIRKMNS